MTGGKGFWMCFPNRVAYQNDAGGFCIKNCQLFMYTHICSLENVLKAYFLACKGNRYKAAVTRYSFLLESNLIALTHTLVNGTYSPRPYTHFTVTDPKKRQIAAPAFPDRIVQHALVKIIEPLFEKCFITDSYACRKGKGTHFALRRLKKFLHASRTEYGQNCEIYILKCDIRKYFPSIDWDVLLTLLKRKINCLKTYELMKRIVTTHEVYGMTNLSLPLDLNEPVSVAGRRGLPIGNLTSQLFANVYLNELDQFVKHELRERWYCRYMDDFLIISNDKKHLQEIKDKINQFLITKLQLSLHPRKSFVENVKNGVSFVGYRVFWDHVLIRGNTLLRMQKKFRKKMHNLKKGTITQKKIEETKSSILGYFKHANCFGLTRKMFGENKVR